MTEHTKGSVHYERRPELDKRIANGDDFAGDAYVRWVAVGHTPNDERDRTELMSERDELIDFVRAVLPKLDENSPLVVAGRALLAIMDRKKNDDIL